MDLSPSPSILANSGVTLLYGTCSTFVVSIIAFAIPSQSVTIYWPPILGSGSLFYVIYHNLRV